MSAPKTKKCFKCGSRKRITSFYKHKRMFDGHLGKCKACAKVDVSANYRKNIDHYREYYKGRGGEARKLAQAAYKKMCRERFPGKRAAQIKSNNAVRDGRLIRGECEMKIEGPCRGRIEGHHGDYRKPLSVLWLCLRHHRAVHGHRPF